MIVIMNKGEVYDNVYFENEQIARNYVKWKHPHKKWVEMQPNILRCKHTGMVMRFEELSPYRNLETELRKGHEDLIDNITQSGFNADTYDYLNYKKDHTF